MPQYGAREGDRGGGINLIQLVGCLRSLVPIDVVEVVILRLTRVGVEILYETDRLPDKGRKDQEQVAGLHQRLVVDGRIEQNGEVYDDRDDIDVADSLAVMDKVQPVPDFDFGRSPYFVHAAGVLCRKNNNKFRFYRCCRSVPAFGIKKAALRAAFFIPIFRVRTGISRS